jgi:hypothetical protein
MEAKCCCAVDALPRPQLMRCRVPCAECGAKRGRHRQSPHPQGGSHHCCRKEAARSRSTQWECSVRTPVSSRRLLFCCLCGHAAPNTKEEMKKNDAEMLCTHTHTQTHTHTYTHTARPHTHATHTYTNSYRRSRPFSSTHTRSPRSAPRTNAGTSYRCNDYHGRCARARGGGRGISRRGGGQ